MVIGVLADLSGAKSLKPPVADRRFSSVTSKSLSQLFRHLAPIVDTGSERVAYSRLDDLFSEPLPVNATLLGVATGARDGQLSSLRSTWAGLRFLVDTLLDRDDAIVKVLDISWNELAKTLKRYKGSAWDQSPIFKKVHEEELGTLGGFPFTMLVCDFRLMHTPTDLDAFRELARIAAAACAPCTIAVTPALLHAVDWRTIPAGFSSSLQAAASFNAQYTELRNRIDASYCVALLPSVRPAGSGPGDWLNPGYAVAAAAVRLLASGEADSTRSSIEDNGGLSLPLEVEWTCPDGLQRQLHALGLNVVDPNSAAPTALNSVRMLRDGHTPLGSKLTICRTFTAVLQRVHELRDVPVPGREALAARRDVANASEWLRERFAEDARGFRVAKGFLVLKVAPQFTMHWYADPGTKEDPAAATGGGEASFRLLIADSSGMRPDGDLDNPPKATIAPLDEALLDDVFAELRLQTADLLGGFESTPLTFSTIHDLAEVSIARQLSPGSSLVDDRRQVIDIGCYTTADEARLGTLRSIAQRKSGFAGLAWLSEGFQSAAIDSNPPLELSDFSPFNDGWPAVGHWGGTPSVEALLTLDRLSAESPAKLTDPIEVRLFAILRDLDTRVAALVHPIRTHPTVAEWEARRHALGALVAQLYSTRIPAALLRQHPRANALRTDALVREWIADTTTEQPVVFLGAWLQFGLDRQKLARLAQVAKNAKGLLVVSLDTDLSSDLLSVLRAPSAQSIILVRGFAPVSRAGTTATQLEFNGSVAGGVRDNEPLLVTAAFRLIAALIDIGVLDRPSVERRLSDFGFDVRPVGAGLMADFDESSMRVDGPV